MPESDTRWREMVDATIRMNDRLCFRVAFGIVRNASLAEDACQQAFLKAWEHRERIEDKNSLRAWLLKVVMNEGLQMLRKKQVEKKYLAEGVRRTESGNAADHDAALRESVVLALDGLPEATRLIVVLRLMDGRSGNEVSDMLGCSSSEVSRRLHHGMSTLRESLNDWVS